MSALTIARVDKYFIYRVTLSLEADIDRLPFILDLARHYCSQYEAAMHFRADCHMI